MDCSASTSQLGNDELDEVIGQQYAGYTMEVPRPFLLRPGNKASTGSVFAHLSCVGQCNCYKKFSSTVLPFHHAG